MTNSMEIWKRFVRLPGAKCGDSIGIAAERAIAALIELVRSRRPQRVLELGSGIGTLTTAVLEAARDSGLIAEPEFTFYTIESQSFCLDQLEINLKSFKGEYKSVRDISEVPKDILFDLIVVDGGGDLPNDLGVIDFSSRLAHHGVILLEGGRGFQRRKILEWYGQRANVIAKITPVQSTLDAGMNGVEARQKPYRLFIFEPSLWERFRLKSQHRWC